MLNFIVGAAVGAVATYVFKDEQAKQWLDDTSKKLQEGAASFMDSFKKKPEETAAEAVQTTAEAGVETVETIADKGENIAPA